MRAVKSRSVAESIFDAVISLIISIRLCWLRFPVHLETHWVYATIASKLTRYIGQP